MRLPAVFFAEGGGGRPGDTDYPGRLLARNPRLRALGAALGTRAADRDRRRPLLRRQRGDRRLLGPDRRHRERLDRDGRAGDDRRRRPRQGRRPTTVGPIEVQARERRGRRRRRRRGRGDGGRQPAALLLPGPGPGGRRPDQAPLREVVPERRRRAYPVAPVIETLADEGSVDLPARALRPEMVTALIRIEGRAGRRLRQQVDPHGRRDHQRRRRQGRAADAALQRLRAAGPLARRHAGDDGRAGGRGDRRSSATADACWSPGAPCGCRSSR